MKVMVLGSGGREHALAWKLAQSEQVEQVVVSPGNPGMERDTKVSCRPFISLEESAEFAKKVGLTIVGPEVLLEQGAKDFFEKKGLPLMGPLQQAARLESSKIFAKEIMTQAGVPTAAYHVARSYQAAKEVVGDWNFIQQGLVLKVDGLAAGKGVSVCLTQDQALQVLEDFWKKGIVGNISEMLLEEKLEGREVSAFALCQGTSFKTLGFACDYKRIRDGHQGPNTGGMGTYSPAFWLSEGEQSFVEEKVFTPVLQVMQERGTPFQGILFAGLMMTEAGPKVLEFNVRFGDPETQVLLPLIETDLLPYFLNVARNQSLDSLPDLRLKNQAAVHVVLAAHGYPGTEGVAVRQGDVIAIDPSLEEWNEGKLFMAGVAQQDEIFVTKGGRVLGLTSWDKTHQRARENVYEKLKGVEFSGMQFRKDIGL